MSRPQRPGNLVPVPGNGQVALSWSASPGAEEYLVMRRNGGYILGTQVIEPGAWELILRTSETSATDPGVVNGYIYGYTVRAWNSAGQSPDSDMATARPISGREICVVNTGTSYGKFMDANIEVFDSTSDGAAPPLRYVRRIAGLDGPAGVAYSAVPDLLAVANSRDGTVALFSGKANGADGPVSVINTGATSSPSGVVFGPSGEEIFVSCPALDSVAVYSTALTAPGGMLRKIAGVSTGLASPRGMAIDPRAGIILVANSGNDSITAFPLETSGDTPPVRRIAGDTTGLRSPSGVAVDGSSGRLLAANSGNNSIEAFPLEASGDVAPLVKISGNATIIREPSGIAVDENSGEIFLANTGNYSILVFPGAAVGNVPPARTISGMESGVNGPVGIAVVR